MIIDLLSATGTTEIGAATIVVRKASTETASTATSTLVQNEASQESGPSDKEAMMSGRQVAEMAAKEAKAAHQEPRSMSGTCQLTSVSRPFRKCLAVMGRWRMSTS